MTKHIVKWAGDVPGWTTFEQHSLYHYVSKQLPKNAKVLELGCGWGKSTWGWLDALPDDCELYILDIFFLNEHSPHLEYLYNQAMARGYKNLAKYIKNSVDAKKTQKDMFIECIDQHPKRHLIKEIYDNDFYKWQPNNEIKFDMVYIDGDHSYQAVLDQLNYFSNVPIVCGDDYRPDEYFDPLKKAVDKYIQDNNKKSEIWCTGREGFYIIYN